jgi:GNAT superfamily N-acetyltransferase
MSADDHMSASGHLSGLQFSSTQVSEHSSAHYARIGDNVVGHAMTNHLPDEPVELAALRVGDVYQGHGIGHGLLNHVIEHHAGSSMTLLPSPFGNKALSKNQLQAFYGSHGFKPKKNGMMTRRARG